MFPTRGCSRLTASLQLCCWLRVFASAGDQGSCGGYHASLAPVWWHPCFLGGISILLRLSLGHRRVLQVVLQACVARRATSRTWCG